MTGGEIRTYIEVWFY